MMDAGLKAWAEVLRRVYPDLTILRDRSQWLAGDFERPSVFIETALVSDRVHTPQADRIIEDVGLVFHFDKERLAEEDEGEPIPFDLTPFFTYLRQKRFCVASERFGIMMVMEPPQLRPKADQVEVTCRYSYLLHVDRVSEMGEKINHFYIEHEGKVIDA